MKDVETQGFLDAQDAAVTATVRRWSPRMLGLALRYARDEDEAHDIVQEAWVLAFRRRHQYDGQGSFPAWLLTICRNVAVSRLRAREPRRSAERVPIPTAPATPEAHHETGLRQRAILDAVLDLPERQRETVALRLIEGLSTRATAARMGCAEGTVKAALHAALRSLRTRLEEWTP